MLSGQGGGLDVEVEILIPVGGGGEEGGAAGGMEMEVEDVGRGTGGEGSSMVRLRGFSL